MLATRQFVKELARDPTSTNIARISVELFGSLALTGLGHSTDRAAIMGLTGEHPRTIDPNSIEPQFAEISEQHSLKWNAEHAIDFDLTRDLIFHRDKSLPRHPNGMQCTAFDANGQPLLQRRYYSIGGGFVISDDQPPETPESFSQTNIEPFPFTSCEELLNICRHHRLTMAEVVHQNELAHCDEREIVDNLDAIWTTMQQCIERGTQHDGILPGGLGIKRRAPELLRKLSTAATRHSSDPLLHMDWVTMFALAVNEENASGGRVVTAPTNGAAGIIPAVLAYYHRFMPDASPTGIHTFLKTAGAIGMLYKRNASLSAAEMGCQGEVGVACSMAAAGLAAVMGGTPAQVENAAEIGMEHNLGLTCDPVAGLVQVPCIERNTMGAVKAINAARLAVLYGDGQHCVSLDRVIETMRQTGLDMQTKYKETSLGGLAVNVINC